MTKQTLFTLTLAAALTWLLIGLARILHPATFSHTNFLLVVALVFILAGYIAWQKMT